VDLGNPTAADQALKCHPMAERTPCARPACPYPGHVVLYAAGGHFDGIHYRRGQAIVFCLKHGGELYDAIQGREYGRAWLAAYGPNDLPTVWADHHIRPHAPTPPWKRGQRVSLPDRPKSSPRRAA
jgi:hypothetical protein